MLSIVLASPERSSAGIPAPVVKDSRSGKLSPRFGVKVCNKSNRMLLFNLQVIDDKSGHFVFRPSHIGVLLSNDNTTIELSAAPNATVGSFNDIGLCVEAAYVEKTNKASIIDPVMAWQNVNKAKIATFRTPLIFNILTDVAASAVEPTVAVIEIPGESAPSLSLIMVVQSLKNFRHDYPEESWAAAMLMIAIIVVLFSIGLYIGSIMPSR